MQLMDQDQERWYCFRDDVTYHAKTNTWRARWDISKFKTEEESVTDQVIAEAKRRFIANMRRIGIKDDKIDATMTRCGKKAKSRVEFIQKLREAIGYAPRTTQGGIALGLIVGPPLTDIIDGVILDGIVPLTGPLTTNQEKTVEEYLARNSYLGHWIKPMERSDNPEERQQ